MMKKIVWKFGVAALAILGWCVSAVADGVTVTSSAGAITVTVSAGTVASSAPVYLVWDTENKGDILSAWAHRAKIGEVTSTGGVFNVTGATHSIPNGAVIRVFVVDGAYDVCEYLQGDGKAYLELDYTLSSADEVTIIAMPNSTDQSGVFGARDGASGKNFTMARTTNSKVVVDVNDKSGYSNYRLDTGWNVGAKVTFVASVARRTANGTGKTNLCPDTFTTAYPCRLFSYAGSMPGSYAAAFKGCVYSFKISTLATSAVQRDLVAVNLGTDANPIPGMYDKETGATYENESPVAGAAFTLGPKTGESIGGEETLSSVVTYEAGEEPEPPEPPTGGVAVESANGAITVTVAAGAVAVSTPVYLVWDTEDQGDAFADWAHSAKIGDVTAEGGVFKVTGATHSIPDGAAIRVFVRDGVALYSAIVKPRTVNAAIVTGYVPGVTRGTAGWDLDAKFDTSYVQVTDGNNFMGVYERFALGGSNFERFSANFGTDATSGKNLYSWPHAVNHPNGTTANARYLVDENGSGEQLRATRTVVSARVGEYLKWGTKTTSSQATLQKWPNQITHDFNAPVAIFGVSDWTSATASSLMYMQIYSMTLYGARFYDKVNDELTVAADYVPAEKNGEKGLYDTMNGVFYPASAEGFAFEGAATNVLDGVSVPSEAATYEAGDTPPTPPVDPVFCPVIDLTGDTVRDSIVAEGTATVYQGHPTTVTTEDGRIIVVWCTPHGGHCGPAAESSDGGRTWTRIDDRFPAGYSRHVNCPSIYRLVGPDGKSRLWVWSEAKMRDTDGATDYQSCRFDATRSMPSVMSEDDGLTWTEVAPLGEKFLCTMAFTSIVRLKDGSYLGVFHTGASCGMENPRRVWQSITTDGGFTWSDPERICYAANREACEPYVFRSPDGNELCCLMRDENHNGRSMMIFSQNEGQSWTSPVDTPWGLTGDRHQGVTLPDGRLVIAFRDRALGSTTAGDFVAWVGTYEELKTCTVGDSYRLRLLRSYDGVDCGYPGIELVSAEEEMITATTYIKYWNDSRKQSIVSKRFSIAEIEGRLDRVMTATVNDATGLANGRAYSCALSMIDPADGWTATWYDENGGEVGATAPSYAAEGVYTNVVKVSKAGYLDFTGTGVVTVTHYDPPEYGTTCLTLPVGANVNGADSTATFATLGVSTAYTYAFSVKNPRAQTFANGRYYGHIMGAGATNTQKGSQKSAPLVIETNDTTGERYIEVQTWTSSGKVQCMTILGYSTSNKSWASEKSQEVQALEDGEWHDVVFTYDATAQHAQVFVDGVKLHDITPSNLAEYLNYTDAGSTFATPSTSGAFCIGRNDAKSDNFAGSLSNVSVWNRALSAEEAVAISGSRLAGNESGLVLYWPLDGETGDVTASDHQVNITAHDGTVYSAGTTACGTYWEEMGTKVPTVVTVTPNANQAKTVGDDDPTLTYTLSQNIAVTGALARAEGETAGDYAITLGTLGAVDPTAYTLELAAETVYFEITAGDTPEPPEGVEVIGANEMYAVGDEIVYVFSTVGTEGKSINLSQAATVDVLVVGGGGAGGSVNGGGGGGGGVVYLQDQVLAAGAYAIAVGAGGAKPTGYAGNNANCRGGNGGDSSFSGWIGKGGGGGGYYSNGAGNAGGCGGGGNGSGAGGASNQESYDGAGHGTGGVKSGSASYGGGGGGAGAAASGKNGGDGFECDIVGTNAWYGAGGGAGQGDNGATTVAPGGAGGGGAGGKSNSGVVNAKDGSFYGAGGGGGNGKETTASYGGAGYQGVVIVRVHPPATKVEATVTDYYGVYDGGPHAATVTVTEPTEDYTITWDDNSTGENGPAYTDAGSYTNVFTVTAEGYLDFVGTGVVEIVAAPAPRKKQGLIIYGTR